MTQTAEAPVAPPPRADERVGRKSPLARLLARPEAGAIAGAIVIYIFFFIIALTQTITNQVSSPDISTLQGFNSARQVFSASWTIGGVNIKTSVVYWIVFVIIATWILLRTYIGNWIFSVGGNAPAARAVGVPVGRMKIGLFMAVGFMAV